MGFMMGPILTICLQGMKGADIGQASGITNMIRQIGGAAGIAGLNIFLTDRGAVHNNALLNGVSIYDPATQDRMAGMGRQLPQRRLFHGTSASHGVPLF
jgi:DHA2 family multidrug resistance protein